MILFGLVPDGYPYQKPFHWTSLSSSSSPSP